MAIHKWGTDFDYVDVTTNYVDRVPAVVYGAVNTNDITVSPYTAFGRSTYAKNTFAELAINVSALIQGFSPCTSLSIKSILVKTKTSNSDTAQLKDIVMPIQVKFDLGLADAGDDQTKCLGEDTVPPATPPVTTFYLTGLSHPSVYAVTSMAWAVLPGGTASASITPPSKPQQRHSTARHRAGNRCWSGNLEANREG